MSLLDNRAVEEAQNSPAANKQFTGEQTPDLIHSNGGAKSHDYTYKETPKAISPLMDFTDQIMSKLNDYTEEEQNEILQTLIKWMKQAREDKLKVTQQELNRIQINCNIINHYNNALEPLNSKKSDKY